MNKSSEDPQARVVRLMRELSDALDDFYWGRDRAGATMWSATVYPVSHPSHGGYAISQLDERFAARVLS